MWLPVVGGQRSARVVVIPFLPAAAGQRVGGK